MNRCAAEFEAQAVPLKNLVLVSRPEALHHPPPTRKNQNAQRPNAASSEGREYC